MTSTPDKTESKQEEAKEVKEEFTLEEDDGFEEFETEDAPNVQTTEKEAEPLWEGDWDDEDVDVDFSEKLRMELERTQAKA